MLINGSPDALHPVGLGGLNASPYFTDTEIKNYVNAILADASKSDPEKAREISIAMWAYKVSAQDVSNATGFSVEQISSFVDKSLPLPSVPGIVQKLEVNPNTLVVEKIMTYENGDQVPGSIKSSKITQEIIDINANQTNEILQTENTKLIEKTQESEIKKDEKMSLITVNPTDAENFHTYIYDGTSNSDVAIAKGLKWYNANRSVYTPSQFVALWNEAEGTKFTIADLDNALIRLGFAPSVEIEEMQTSTEKKSVIPLVLAVAAAYFLGV